MAVTDSLTTLTHELTKRSAIMRPQLSSSGAASDTVYLRGLSRRIAPNELMNGILNIVEEPVETDFSLKPQTGEVWARYSSFATAQRTVMKLHQTVWYGVCLNARIELGKDENGKRITPKNNHNTVVRSVNYRKGYAPSAAEISDDVKKKAEKAASYTHKSVLVGNFEYPFPTGLYLSRVIQLTRNIPRDDPLLDILTDPCLGNKYGKEISEIMAMADCVHRALHYILGLEASAVSNAVVYVLGDGKRPLCAAAICIQSPESWKFVSIDPLLEDGIDVKTYGGRFILFKGKSERFDLSDTASFSCESSQIEFSEVSPLSIVIAPHSHAPLSEFWERLGGLKIAITMECCAGYSELNSSPLLEFDDFEVYSPKRRVKVYSNVFTSKRKFSST